ncbi:hypothetical protein GH714_024998 [Hevea brasiliensis]|uniref:SPARK domain-containing protein n=1 Tax=Hevea brasiliensis TaxID=3981 RepID=A0A6A6M0B7_HEVBR|nr:hypothetical protein GH714_024998 [Hevea brasiliensis]
MVFKPSLNMSLVPFTFLPLVLVLAFSNFCTLTANRCKISNRNLTESSCPLNFDVLRKLAIDVPIRLALVHVPSQCQHIQKGILFVRSEYLRTSGHFVPPPETFQACWESYRCLVADFLHGFDIQSTCGYHPEWISDTYINITTRPQFESLIPRSELQELRLSCNQSLENGFVCQSCIHKVSSIQKLFLQGPETENTSDSSDYLFMYAAAFSNKLGLRDPATAKCLFRLEFSMRLNFFNKKYKSVISGGVLGKVSLLTDWAWKRVKEGKSLDVIEEKMPEMESPEVMELHVHIAVICAHPILFARPTMYQIVKMLETKLQLVPSTLGAYIGGSNSVINPVSSGYMSCSSITSDDRNLDNRDTRESFTVTIVQ